MRSEDSTNEIDVLTPTFGSRFIREPIPKNTLPSDEMPSRVAYQVIHDELEIDCHPLQNMASFVTTWVEPEAEALIVENAPKNIIDLDEYPQANKIADRCVAIVSDLLHAPENGIGTTTIGSSEAGMLAGLAMKFRWKEAGHGSGQPNLVRSRSVHVCWEKFCTFFDVEQRIVPLGDKAFQVDPDAYEALIDENTIGVLGVMGTTTTGLYEPIEQIAQVIERVNRERDLNVGIHVDAASGGFVAPFLDADIKWDFRIPCVRSINVSGHKYGLALPGIGLCIWRSKCDVPGTLRFPIDYLGGTNDRIVFNFTRSSAPIVVLYYNFLRLGRKGYTRVMENIRGTAVYLAGQLLETGIFTLVNDPSVSIPIIVARLSRPDVHHPDALQQICKSLRQHGWVIPVYNVPFGAKHNVPVMRICVRESFSRDQADMLIEHFTEALQGFHTLETGEPDKRPIPESHLQKRTHRIIC